MKRKKKKGENWIDILLESSIVVPFTAHTWSLVEAIKAWGSALREKYPYIAV